MLSLDATYSLAMIRARRLEHEITCRDLDGFFEHVWSVHPVVGASPEHAVEYGAERGHRDARIADRHTMLEGTVAWSRRLARFPMLNFLVAQLALLRRLNRLIRDEDVCVVRVGDPFYLGLLGLLLARLNRLPLVVRINCNYDNAYADGKFLAYPRLLRWRWLEKAVSQFVLARADLVAPGSRDNLEYALANGATPERSTIWGYGTWVDPLHFEVEPQDRPSVRAELGLEDRPFMVLVSRLEAVKHPEDVVRVLAEARKRTPSLVALLVGGGSMQEELEQLERDLGVDDGLRIVGYRDQPWLGAALSSADIVVSPITGRALVEACLSATPVVAYDIEWQSEIIRPGDTGVLVPYRDVGAMATAVCDLLEDPDRAAALGRRARAVVSETMNPRTLLAREQADYEQLLSGAERRGSVCSGMPSPASFVSTRLLPAPVRQKVGGWLYGTRPGWFAWFVREGLRDTGWLRSAKEHKPVTRDGSPLPWYTYGAIHFLQGRLQPSMRVFEYGSGNSTLWYASRVDRVVSVDHDPAWVRSMAELTPDNSTIVLQTDMTAYVNEIKQHEGPFDVIVVDGIWRPESAAASVDLLAPDGVIVWDNSNSEEFAEARRNIAGLSEFREIEFHGFGPSCVRFWSTTVLYRPGANCLGI